MVYSIFNIPELKAVVLESYGAGNAPRSEWFFDEIKRAVERGILILNRSQCTTGAVEMGRYETSLNLMSLGVISAYDCTAEAIVTKLMCLFGEYKDLDQIKRRLRISLRGEMTIS